MTDRNKFEEMLERLVNEDKEGAEALFHEIVVEKSRDIYESLLEDEDEAVEETTDEEVDEATDEEVDESEEDLDEATDEEVDEATDEEVDEAADEDLDEADEEVDENFFDVAEADPVDDMMGDIEDPDMGGDEMDMDMGGDDDMGMGDEEGDVEDRVADLEDELEALKAEFEAMMGDEEPGDEAPADDMDMDMDSEEGDDEEEAEEEAVAFEAADEEVEEATDEEVEESKLPKSQTEIMREYTDKVSASMGDNGANSKSVVAGKNDMGGTTANIAKGGDADTKGAAGGLAQPSTKEDNAGNVNVPGGKASKSMKSQPGHGAEKKGKPETADKGAGSPLNGAPKRAK